jgi:hypothetical protein
MAVGRTSMNSIEEWSFSGDDRKCGSKDQNSSRELREYDSEEEASEEVM